MSKGFLFDLSKNSNDSKNPSIDVFNLEHVINSKKTDRLFQLSQNSIVINSPHPNQKFPYPFHLYRTPNCNFKCNFCNTVIKNGGIAAGCRMTNVDACQWCLKNNKTARDNLITSGKTSFFEQSLEIDILDKNDDFLSFPFITDSF